MKEDLIGLGTLMSIFGISIILIGIYIYTGHKNELLFWKTHNIEKITKEQLKVIGRILIIIGIIITLIGCLCLLGYMMSN